MSDRTLESIGRVVMAVFLGAVAMTIATWIHANPVTSATAPIAYGTLTLWLVASTTLLTTIARDAKRSN